jgi:hypothetical protein
MPAKLINEDGGRERNPTTKRNHDKAFKMLLPRLQAVVRDGEWKVRPVGQRDRKGTPVFRVMGLVSEYGASKIRVWCRPHAADSAWEFDIVPSKGADKSTETLQKIVDLLRANEEVGTKYEVDAEVEKPLVVPVSEVVVPPVEVETIEPPRPAAAVTQTSARDLKAMLGRLHLIVEKAEKRQEEIVRVTGQIDKLQQQLVEVRKVFENHSAQLAASEAKLQTQLVSLKKEDADDQALLQTAQVLGLAGEISL